MKYWLMKTEADVFSIDDLKRVKREAWTGVRNYQARNFMKEMKKGDLVLFYHSSSDPTGVAGIAKVVAEAHPDESAFDVKSDYFDSKSKRESPLWSCVDVGFVKTLPGVITLATLKADPKLRGMRLLEPGSRLSVQPVSEAHFKYITERLA